MSQSHPIKGKTMRVIFLDIDGVLNDVHSRTRSPSGFIGIDDDKVRVLRQIVKQTGAKIVLTSTWKRGWNAIPELRETEGVYLSNKLWRRGLRILDKTDDAGDPSLRGAGIQRWLQSHGNVSSWLVLDDEIFPDYEKKGIMSHLVQTHFRNGGLSEDHIPKCIEILR